MVITYRSYSATPHGRSLFWFPLHLGLHFRPFPDTTFFATCGSGITKDAVWRTQEKKKGRSGTRRTRERNAEIIRIQFTREFHAGLLLCPTFAVEVPDLIGKKKCRSMSTTKDRGRRTDREKMVWEWKTNGGERNRDERMVRIIGARHEKLPKTKAAERTAGRETPRWSWDFICKSKFMSSGAQTGRIRRGF